MTYDEIQALAALDCLDISGAFYPEASDGLATKCKTLLLLSPAPSGFWAHFSNSAECRDGLPDPVDRWSLRVITALADSLGAKPLFPFDGPPYAPFMHWARRSGRAWNSPVHLLSHDSAGLMISYRGALALPTQIDIPDVKLKPVCGTCARPCTTACPAGAITEKSYDVDRCHQYLAEHEDAPCLSQGCHVRLACPLSQGAGRLAEQSAYHMGQFHP